MSQFENRCYLRAGQPGFFVFMDSENKCPRCAEKEKRIQDLEGMIERMARSADEVRARVRRLNGLQLIPAEENQIKGNKFNA